MLGVADLTVDEPVDAVGITVDENVEGGAVSVVDDPADQSPIVVHALSVSIGRPLGRGPRPKVPSADGGSDDGGDRSIIGPRAAGKAPRRPRFPEPRLPLPRDLTPSEAAAALKADPAAVYLDVRSSMEFAQGHPPGAINVPLAEFDPARGMYPNPRFAEVVGKLFPPATPLVVGCASGGRSKQAQAVLAQKGYGDVANVLGGFAGGMGPTGPVAGWAGCGLPVAKDGCAYAEALKRAGG